MLALGVSASDLSVLLCQALAGVVLSVPLGLVLVAAQAGTGGGTAPWPWSRRRTLCAAWGLRVPRASARRGAAAGQRQSQGATAAPQRGRDALYVAQLRRAAPVVRLFAAAPPGGEREAAYQALVRLAVAADADTALEASLPGPPACPGTLYRALVRGGPGIVGALAFDARVCAELDRRDAVRLQGRP